MTIDTLKHQLKEKQREHDEATLQAVCLAVGIGVRDICSRRRSLVIAASRRVVVETLRNRHGWSQARTARHLGLTKRQVARLTRY